eukprot:8240130-Pyramimonas_sp.AAC.1
MLKWKCGICLNMRLSGRIQPNPADRDGALWVTRRWAGEGARVAVHKMARLLTVALGGEAYLAFMGN